MSCLVDSQSRDRGVFIKMHGVGGGGREKWEHNINTGKPHREAFHSRVSL